MSKYATRTRKSVPSRRNCVALPSAFHSDSCFPKIILTVLLSPVSRSSYQSFPRDFHTKIRISSVKGYFSNLCSSAHGGENSAPSEDGGCMFSSYVGMYWTHGITKQKPTPIFIQDVSVWKLTSSRTCDMFTREFHTRILPCFTHPACPACCSHRS
jgi:hypothetical protein